MIVLPNMGLVKWDSINDSFSHEQLAANFQTIDEHNHTAGKGVQIPYGGLAEQSVGIENLRESVPIGETRKETVASANTITIKNGISLVEVTGTTEIKKITATVAGHRTTLKFAGILKVVDGENLKLNGNFETTADDTITLVCDGTNWYETSRSAN